MTSAFAPRASKQGKTVRDWVPIWRRALALGLVYALLATPLDSLGHADKLAAVVWPAPGIALARLWRLPRREWAPSLSVIFVVMLGMGQLDAFSFSTDVCFALLNVVGIALSLELATRFVSADARIDTIDRLIRFVIFIPFLSVVVMGFLSALLAHEAHAAPLFDEWANIVGSSALAKLTLVPGLLEWTQDRHPDARRPRKLMIIAPAVCASAMMVLALRLQLPDHVEHGLLIFVLLWAAIWGSMRGATLATFALALTGIVMTVSGNGSYHGRGFAGIHALQFDLVVLSSLAYFVAIALDEQRVSDARLERAHKLETLGMMVSGIAHDFNNVLAAVQGHAEYADELVEQDSAARRPLGYVLAAVRSGRALTEQMLLSVGRGSRKRDAAVSMRNVIDEAIAIASPDASRQIRVEQSDANQDGSDCFVWGDRGQIVRVAVNLIRNGSHAARVRVVVEYGEGLDPRWKPAVGTLPPEPAFWLAVHDDGPGIEPHRVQQIFEPFYSTRAGRGGHGLGLSIAAGIVETHRGALICERSPLGGALFIVALPAYADVDAAQSDDVVGTSSEEHRVERQSASDLHDAWGEGAAVLIVEDDDALLVLLEDWLAELGFEPLGHADPAMALATLRLRASDIALVVSDLDLPSMRGDALIAQVRADTPSMPALLISAAPDAPAIADAAHLDFLAKPFGHSQFASAVRKLVPRSISC